MDSLLLVIGILLGLLFSVAFTLLLTINPKTTPLPMLLPIERLKKRTSEIRAELQILEEQLWVYGVDKEDENRKWTRAYMSFANKTINAMQSCWIGKDEDPTAKATYDELITGLKTIGIEEIIPNVGDKVDDNDKKVSIRVINGKPPFVVRRLVYPGYQLNSNQLGTTVVLSPAIVEVTGVK